MNFLKYLLLPSLAASSLALSAYAEEANSAVNNDANSTVDAADSSAADAAKNSVVETDNALPEADNSIGLADEDNAQLEEYIREKEAIPTLAEPHILFSGDSRLRYKKVHEALNGVPQVGSGSGTTKVPQGFPNDQWVVEANLKFSYATEQARALVQLKFKNPMGIVSGTTNALELTRAYIGYSVWDKGTNSLVVVGGRMRLEDYFDSVVQFDSRLDGIFAVYGNTFNRIGDFYVEGAMFIIDTTTDHYGWVGETGLEKIADSGFYARYSLIDWRHNGRSRSTLVDGKPVIGLKDDPRWRFTVSQVTVGYEFVTPWVKKNSELYGAFLINTAAERLHVTNFEKQNKGWYVGYLVGTIQKQGDWAFEILYEWVEAQAVPDVDSGDGIGRGNAFGANLYDKGPGGDPKLAHGNTNYKGIDIAMIYAITDELTLNGEYQRSNEIDRNIGGKSVFSSTEIKFIYSF